MAMAIYSGLMEISDKFKLSVDCRLAHTSTTLTIAGNIHNAVPNT